MGEERATADEAVAVVDDDAVVVVAEQRDAAASVDELAARLQPTEAAENGVV